jgi:hypothetical protein
LLYKRIKNRKISTGFPVVVVGMPSESSIPDVRVTLPKSGSWICAGKWNFEMVTAWESGGADAIVWPVAGLPQIGGRGSVANSKVLLYWGRTE